MTITQTQFRELQNMLRNARNSHRSFDRKITAIMPLSRQEKTAQRVLKLASKKREKLRGRLRKQFDKLYADAHATVYFGVDLKKALAAIEKLKAFK